MSKKQSDPVYILAEQIIESAQQIAASQANKAPYDKSYKAVILGTNRKFTDDVTVEEQAELIQKFSIPESVADDEPSYYTIKINGAYYCKAQNGDFKLYEKVMVYIPNGEWSKMYIDRVGVVSSEGGGGSDPVVLPNVIVAVDEPPIIRGGDFLATVEEHTTLTSLKRYSDNKWQDVEFLYGTNYNDLTVEGVYYGWFTEGDMRVIFEYVTDHVQAVAYSAESPYLDYNVFYTETPDAAAVGDYWIEIDNETDQNLVALHKCQIDEDTQTAQWVTLYNAAVPSVYIQVSDPANTYTVKNGAYWIEIDNDTDKNMKYLKKRIEGNWVIQCAAISGTDVTINISHAILVDKGQIVE